GVCSEHRTFLPALQVLVATRSPLQFVLVAAGHCSQQDDHAGPFLLCPRQVVSSFTSSSNVVERDDRDGDWKGSRGPDPGADWPSRSCSTRITCTSRLSMCCAMAVTAASTSRATSASAMCRCSDKLSRRRST